MNLLKFSIAALCLVLPVFSAGAEPLGSAFSYQGQLNFGGSPVTAPQDLQFGLYDAPTGGAQIGTTNTLTSVPVEDGLFSVSLDFGASAFGGQARYLHVQVKPTGTATAYTSLTPRQKITPAPVALAVADGGVTGAALADRSVSRSKITSDFNQYLTAVPVPATFISAAVPLQKSAPSKGIEVVNGKAVMPTGGNYMCSVNFLMLYKEQTPHTLEITVNDVVRGTLALHYPASTNSAGNMAGSLLLKFQEGDTVGLKYTGWADQFGGHFTIVKVD